MSSPVQPFSETSVYQFAINIGGRSSYIGGGSVESNAVRPYVANTTNPNQQWTVINVNETTPDYPYRLRLSASGFFLSALCDFSVGSDCRNGTVDRARLVSATSPEQVPDSGQWKVEASNSNDGSYYWYSKANSTEAWLDYVDGFIVMNRNSSAGSGGGWTLLAIEGLQASTTSSSPPPTTTPTNEPTSSSTTTSTRLSGGAIAGIVIAVVAANFIILGLTMFWFRRRRERRKHQNASGYHQNGGDHKLIAQELNNDSSTTKSELGPSPDYSHQQKPISESLASAELAASEPAHQPSELPSASLSSSSSLHPSQIKSQRLPVELPGS